MKLNLDKNHFL